jgi:alkylation response protein AidB-like acyl-CoA dehydrogenase
MPNDPVGVLIVGARAATDRSSNPNTRPAVTAHEGGSPGTKLFGRDASVWQADGDHSPMGAEFTRSYVGSVPHTIYSGSSEIQRNVIATRGLGLPRG